MERESLYCRACKISLQVVRNGTRPVVGRHYHIDCSSLLGVAKIVEYGPGWVLVHFCPPYVLQRNNRCQARVAPGRCDPPYRTRQVRPTLSHPAGATHLVAPGRCDPPCIRLVGCGFRRFSGWRWRCRPCLVGSRGGGFERTRRLRSRVGRYRGSRSSVWPCRSVPWSTSS